MQRKRRQERLQSIRALKFIIFFKLINKEYDIELEPRSLEYNDDISKGISAREQISLRGFFTRINNVLSDKALQKRLEKNKNDL